MIEKLILQNIQINNRHKNNLNSPKQLNLKTNRH